MKKVCFDIDCTLNDFELDFCTKFGWNKREIYNLYQRYPDKQEEIRNYLYDCETYRNLNLLYAPYLLYTYFQLMMGVSVYIGTSRPDECFHSTIEWIDRHSLFPEEVFFSRDDKVSLMVKNGMDILIDDSLEQLTKAQSCGILAVAWRQPWNSGWFPAFSADRKGNVLFAPREGRNMLFLRSQNDW
jgi:5'(3')-deoxyribonucleotidase